MADVTVESSVSGRSAVALQSWPLTMGSRVVATRKRGATGARPTIETDEDEIEALIDVLPADSLPDLVAQSDFIVLALPLTPGDDGPLRCGPAFARQTRGVAHQRRAWRAGRRPRAGARCARRLGGAVLDTFGEEPLPAEPELTTPNISHAPHVVVLGRVLDRNIELFCENLGRFPRRAAVQPGRSFGWLLSLY